MKLPNYSSSRWLCGAGVVLRLFLIVIIMHAAVQPVFGRPHVVNCRVCSCFDDYVICTKENSLSTWQTVAAIAGDNDAVTESTQESGDFNSNVSSLFVFFFQNFKLFKFL